MYESEFLPMGQAIAIVPHRIRISELVAPMTHAIKVGISLLDFHPWPEMRPFVRQAATIKGYKTWETMDACISDEGIARVMFKGVRLQAWWTETSQYRDC